ncbi:hypothetical protein [Mucilaginibacter sp. SP1R1]|uniref:hypothetical protein n=1 Tax=Mucilaginibacter sp. SP1R1 TaxID=2723091 RepID=UPI001614EEB4|nr:hypothetical protein [Mucilaginibacter sp. SP1R1]MBB6151181.1 hypothetical protein [Mucilaginibacter sp. SP1R1]
MARNFLCTSTLLINKINLPVMNIEDHIWKLATRKLCHEATEDELLELSILLNEHPDIGREVKLLFIWWSYDDEQAAVSRSERMFNRIKEKIKRFERLIKNN